MKKTAAAFTILALAMIALALASFNTASAGASPSYSIESVNHSVRVLYNGYVLVNDTITISGQPDSFLLGFPHAFGANVIRGFAYSTNDTSNMFPVVLNVPLENRSGFYGAEVDFTKGAPHVFSVVFVLSNSLVVQDAANGSMYTLSFPAFPSLAQIASVCDCSVVVPGAQYVNGTVSSFTYSVTNLSAFTYNASQVAFFLPNTAVQVYEIKQLTRRVNVNALGQTDISDTYSITNNSTQVLASVNVDAPANASNVAARDLLGPLQVSSVAADTNLTRYRITFSLPAYPNGAETFTVTYGMPSDANAVRQGNSFAANMTFFQDENSYVDQASVTFVLPEGARLSSFGTTSTANSNGVNHDVFQETLTVYRQNVISFDSFAVSLDYQYNPLWLALVPTMVIWALAVGGTALVAAWRRPRAPREIVVPSAGLKLRSEDVTAFVDAYDEKVKIETEMDALETRVQKGRIPRRRYKVQKRTFEIRISTLDRELADIGGKIHSAGGHYSELMRQLEVAETEMDEVVANMKSIEARLGRGEISMETYRKLSADYERRKDRSKATINGILLRLREETR